MPDMHISFVPILHGVPSTAESPHGTINESSESVQYSSHGSSFDRKINKLVKMRFTINFWKINTYGYQNKATIHIFCHGTSHY